MRIRELYEQRSYRLDQLAQVVTEFEDAHFWLQRRGSRKSVGRVITDEYNPENIGIGVFRPDIILPDFLKYAMMNLHSQGYWEERAYGTLELVHIRISDVREIQLGQ